MINIILVGIGGAIGALMRYFVGELFSKYTFLFPVSTLLINVTGSYLLSVVLYLSEYTSLIPEQARLFLSVGILGAFTTMSAFGSESVRLLDSGNYVYFALYILLTVGLVIGAVILGKLSAGGLAHLFT